tara:strand:+ start:105 stop:320 length:216 start_codon:yes stop_codon:yes gene_type:complete
MSNSSEASFCVYPLKNNNSIMALHLSASFFTNSLIPIASVELSRQSLDSNISTKKSELRFCFDCLNFLERV